MMAKPKPKQVPPDQCDNCRFGLHRRDNAWWCRRYPTVVSKQGQEWCWEHRPRETEERITE